jgi:hypothetical protein
LILGIHTMSIWFGLKTGCDSGGGSIITMQGSW